MKSQDALNAIERLIQERSILEHPFYVAWRSGDLTREQLGIYASAYYPHVAAFPGYLEAAIGKSDDPSIRSELERNHADELANPAPHTELWLDFAGGLGLDRTAVKDAQAEPAAREIIATFSRLVHRHSSEALAALYAYESQQPEVSRQKSDGLRDLYGVTDPGALAYFEVHAELDREHRKAERQALQRSLQDGGDGEAALKATSAALDAYWGLLDGICQEAGVAFAN